MESSFTISNMLKRFREFRYQLVFESVCVGVLAGVVVVLFRLLVEGAGTLVSRVGAYAAAHQLVIPVWFGVLLLLSVATTLLLKWEPMISGSGIPQMDGEIQGRFSQVWWRVLTAKFAGGIMTIGAGLSLGREGPSIQLGAMVGKGFSRVAKRMRTEEKLLITCGASAGLSAAFNAPLAGALFALEEVHKSFSIEVLLSSMAASVTSDFVSRNVFGLSPVFDFSGATVIPLSHFPAVLLLGVLTGLFGVAYNFCTRKAQDLYGKLPSPYLRTAIPFFLAGVLLFACPAVMGGGNGLVMQVAQGLPLLLLVGLFALKFVFSLVSFGSGVPGGIFLPMLVLGALCGGLFHGVAEGLGLQLDLQALVILGMAGCFSAIVRAPVTGIVLITEMSGDFSHLMFLSMVSLIAYIVADLLHARPIYEQLLRRMLHGGLPGPKAGGAKVLLETAVCPFAPVCGKRLSELALPGGCLVVSVKREGAELVPRGQTRLSAGDVLVTLCDEADSAVVSGAMGALCKSISR